MSLLLIGNLSGTRMPPNALEMLTCTHPDIGKEVLQKLWKARKPKKKLYLMVLRVWCKTF